MNRLRTASALIFAGALGVALPLGDVRGESRAQAAHPSRAEKGSSNDAALAALKEMSAKLASARTLRFKVRNLVPYKGPGGGWVTLVGSGNVAREGKDRLFVETGGDLYPFRFYFDGKTVTAYAPKADVYAQRDAPGTIDEALERAARRGEAAFVFADVVSSDPYAAMTRGLQSASVVGISTIDGEETQHVAAHAKSLDWEIWISTKDRLPRMVTLTDTTDARKPTHTVFFSDWALDVALPGDAFTFTKPPEAVQVPFRDPRQQASARRGGTTRAAP